MIQEWNHTVRKMVGAHCIWPVEPPFKFIPTCNRVSAGQIHWRTSHGDGFWLGKQGRRKNSMMGPATNLLRPIWGICAWHVP